MIRLFGKHAVLYAIGNICLRAAAFFLIPLYTRFLPINDYGLLSSLLLTNQILMIFMDLGMRIALLRFATEYKNEGLLGHLIGTSLAIVFIGWIAVTCLSTFCLTSFFRSVLHTDDIQLYIFLTCSLSLVQAITIYLMSYYRSGNDVIKYMKTGIASAILLIIVNAILLIGFKAGIRGVLIGTIISYGTVLLFIIIDILPRTGINISATVAKRLLPFGSPLVFAMLGQLIMSGTSIYFLSYYFGLKSVAIFSLGQKLAGIVDMALVYPFQLALQPLVYSNMDKPDLKSNLGRLLTYYVLSIVLFSFIFLSAIRILFPLIAPPEYSSAFLIILFLMPVSILRGIYYFGETLITITKKTYYTGAVITCCALLSLLLNYMLIPRLEQYGAILSINASYFLAGFIVLIMGTKQFPLAVEKKRIFIVSVIFVLVFLYFIKTRNLAYSTSIIINAFAFSSILIYLAIGKFFNDREKAVAKSFLSNNPFRKSL